jgi:AraC-like DNA-binding protein
VIPKEALMSRVCTVQAKAVEKIVDLAATHGIEARSLYEAIKFSPALLVDPDHRIPFAQLVSLYEQAALLTGDEDFGLHLGERVDPKLFDVVGYSGINSPTFGEAIDRIVRYHSIWTDGAVFSLARTNSKARLGYRYVDYTVGDCRQDCEMTLAAVVALGRQVTSSQWSPIEVLFQHAKPHATEEHARVLGAPLRFGRETNELVFDSATLALPIVRADPGLCTVLDRHADQLLLRYPRHDSLIDQVRSLIQSELPGGDLSLERVAEQIGTSARTLQRRLRALGTSHHELLDQTRRDLARRYLSEPGMAVCEAAYLLGFSESSALHRAFKRWTGVTPNEFRDKRHY